jgi:hypothetical protein
MATGHINPGYEDVVTRFRLALRNPSGARCTVEPQKLEMAEIRARARSAWAIKDLSATTYGHFHSDPVIKEAAQLRPTSPTRRNNPHPEMY